jgi:hypothetical protein
MGDNFWKESNQRRVFKAFLLGPLAAPIVFTSIGFFQHGRHIESFLLVPFMASAQISYLFAFVFGFPTFLLLRKIHFLNLITLSFSGALMAFIVVINASTQHVYLVPQQHDKYEQIDYLFALLGFFVALSIGLIARIPILGFHPSTSNQK